MRRGTPPAIEFGEFLRMTRQSKGLSMRQIAEVIGGYAATVSQIEKGQRALKEPKIAGMAKALGVEEFVIRDEWLKCNSEKIEPIVRRRNPSTPKKLEDLIYYLNGSQRDRVRGYIECLLERE